MMPVDVELCHCPLTAIATHPPPSSSSILRVYRLQFYSLGHISRLALIVKGSLCLPSTMQGTLLKNGLGGAEGKKRNKMGKNGRGTENEYSPITSKGISGLWRHVFYSLLCQIPCVM